MTSHKPVKIEWFRQSWHFTLSLLMAFIFLYAGFHIAVTVLFSLLLLGACLSFLVLRGFKIPFISKHVWDVSRTHEQKIPGQAAFILLGSILLTFILFQPFPPLVTFAGILCLALTDSFSTIIGQLFGKHYIFPNKTLEGTTGGLIAGLIGLSFFFPLWSAFTIAIVASITEMLPIDDNVSIPLAASLAALVLISLTPI